MKNPIPIEYPTELKECLKVFETFSYKSLGFGVVFLYYDYTFKSWSMMFRNPENFDNPKIRAETPLQACHSMFDFLNEQYEKNIMGLEK